MGKTRSMMRKKKYDDSNWSDVSHDVLSLVMMKLGVVEFLAFRRVCKSWRSLADSNKNKFLASRAPMSLSVSINDKDSNLSGRTCVGVTCGYMILFGESTSDFWLLNPMTKHELHFPDIPDDLFYCPVNHRAILVFSPSISGCVFVVFNRCYNDKIWFSIAGKREWTCIYTDRYPIHDLIAFKGKIYTVHSVHVSDELRLCELKIYPEPKLVLLQTQSFPTPNFRRPGFLTCGENLFLIDMIVSEHPYNIHELDREEMKWVSHEKKGKEYSFFLYDFKLCDDHL